MENPPPAASPPDPVEGKTISAVEIRYTKPKTADEAALRGHIATEKGHRYRSETVDGDIKSLYESGLVEDVRVLAEPVGENVKVTFEIEPRGLLR